MEVLRFGKVTEVEELDAQHVVGLDFSLLIVLYPGVLQHFLDAIEGLLGLLYLRI